MSISEIIILIFSFILIIPTLASLTRFDQWWIRGFDFPRIQIFILNFLMIAISFIFYSFEEIWHLVATVFLLLSLIYQFVKIFPYTILCPKQVLKHNNHDSSTSISLLVSNVLKNNRNSSSLIELVTKKKPDFLLTLESDKRWEKELEVLEEEYKYTVKVPQDNLYGMHLYSRLKLKDIQVRCLVQEGIPSIHGFVVLPNSIKVRIHCLHPMPPSPTESDTSTNRDAELLMLGRDIKKNAKRVLVFGDLNDVAWSRTTKLFLKMSGLLDPRIGRGFYNTFHADYPLLRWPLDHVFHTKDFTLVKLATENHIGSDHFPMYIKLNLSPELEDENERKPEPESEEKEWATEKIKDANPLETSI